MTVETKLELDNVKTVQIAISKTRRTEVYVYRNADLKIVHWTSVPQNDEDAVEYLRTHMMTLMNAKFVERVLETGTDGKDIWPKKSVIMKWHREGDELYPWPVNL